MNLLESDICAAIAQQIPIVAAFAWFVLKRDKDYNAVTEKRIDEWRCFLSKTNEKFVMSLKEISGVVDDLSKQVSRNTTITVMTHDAMVRGHNGDHAGLSKDLINKIME